MSSIDKSFEKALVSLVNDHYNYGIFMDEYRKIEFTVYSENILNQILDKCKFKSIGSALDFPDVMPQPEVINGYDLTLNFDLYQKIYVSEKFDSMAYITVERYSISCTFLIDTEMVKKFSKIFKKATQQDSRANMFREIDFKCKKGEYIEVSDSTGDSMKPADVSKKKVAKEKLVFDESATIVEVMKNIQKFFTEEEKAAFKKLDIPYKRGIILHGDPGNGKSAMIREIIRTVPNIGKVVINPNVSSVTKILSSLIKSLEGRPALVIIEDIDSLITDRNRSEFLNILDGVDISSGVYFIGTTNYPDRIDPAFMNRAGRFDRMYKIENPSETTRRKFFSSRNIGDNLAEYKTFKDDSIPDSDEGVVELFVKFSDGLPMASLKEIMTATRYLLADNPDMTIEEALEKSQATILGHKEEHGKSHNKFKRNRRHENLLRRFEDDDDDDE